MREDNAQRRMHKKMDASVRDMDGATGNAKSFHKAVRRYGKALVDSAMEDIAVDHTEDMVLCVMCGKPCVSLCCTYDCYKEAINLGIILPETTAYC